jgi:hypothetical protein
MAELAHRARRPVTLRHSGILFKPNVKQTIAVHTDSPSGSGLMSLVHHRAWYLGVNQATAPNNLSTNAKASFKPTFLPAIFHGS